MNYQKINTWIFLVFGGVRLHLTVLRPKCHRQIPARFQDSDTESNNGVLCTICSEKESPGCLEIVFWIYCNTSDACVHTYCAFGSNTNSCWYVCDTCASSH